MARVPLHIAVAAVALGLGCGSKPASPPPVVHDARPADAVAAVEIEAAPLGMPELAAFGWRKRGGQPAFRLARKAEDAGDWAAVVTTRTQALAADPGHLEAAWLLAVGYAKLGQLDRVLAPLHQAAAGDFAKWGPASLELPALQPFLATPAGEAWRRRVEQDRARLIAALARAIVVTADGDLYAVEIDGARWHRLTRTSGLVIGALPIGAAHQLAYVTRTPRSRAAPGRELGLGVIDLARGKGSRPVALGTAGPIVVAFSARPPIGFWVGTGAPRATSWRQLDDDYRFHVLPARTPRPSGAWLDVSARAAVRVHALPPHVTADWDEQSLASAIWIGTSNRVVSVPSPGSIDGNTASWSPDRGHLAFIAQLDEHCAADAVNTAVFVAEASTGSRRELARAAAGLAVQWLSERTLAIAGDHGVVIRALDDDVPPFTIEGATGLAIPRERPRCAPPDPADPAAPAPDASRDEPEPAEASATDE